MDKDLDKLADLLGNLLEKYADKIDFDSLPDIPPPIQQLEVPSTAD